MPQRGLTLIELLTALIIVGLLSHLAFGAWQPLERRAAATAALNRLIGAVSLARQTALTHRRRVILCSGRQGDCAGSDAWHHGARVFIDANHNARMDPGDTLIRSLPPLPEGARVYWRSFRNRRFLAFSGAGITEWQNGHFLYCPPQGSAVFAREIILNAAGRVRIARDRDGDGIVENARGQAVRCPRI